MSFFSFLSERSDTILASNARGVSPLSCQSASFLGRCVPWARACFWIINLYSLNFARCIYMTAFEQSFLNLGPYQSKML